MKHFWAIPAVFLLMGSAFAASTVAVERSILESLSAGKIQSVYISARNWAASDTHSIKSFEPPNVCGDFDLSPADVRKFFEKAQVVDESSERGKAIRHNGGSRCALSGRMALQDGTKLLWSIDRARNGKLSFSSSGKPGFDSEVSVYCDTCQDEKFYPSATQNPAPYRPQVEGVVIRENGERVKKEYGSGVAHGNKTCTDFKLTENEVKEYFNLASVSSGMEFQDTDNTISCVTHGEATLRDGKKSFWHIYDGRQATMIFSEKPSKDGLAYFFYCYDCTSKKFVELCEGTACMNAP